MIVVKPKTVEVLANEAETIAKIIQQTQIDQRALLFKLVASELVMRTQGYTARLFNSIADML